MDMLTIFMLIIALSFLYYIFRSINKNRVSLGNSMIWILIGIALVIFSIFNKIPESLSHLLGFQLTSNFLLFLGVLFLLVISFSQSLQLSKQKNQITMLIQEVSLIKSSIEEKEKNK